MSETIVTRFEADTADLIAKLDEAQAKADRLDRTLTSIRSRGFLVTPPYQWVVFGVCIGSLLMWLAHTLTT